MLDMSKDFLGVSVTQINAIAGRQILDVEITVARPRLRGHPHDMSQHVRQRIACWGAGPQLRPAFRSSCRTTQTHDRRMLPCGHENPRSRVPWPQRQIETFEPVSHPLRMATRSAQLPPLSHQASSTVCGERPAADDQCSPPAVVRCCFQFPSPRKLRGCWLQQRTADQAISNSLSPPSNPLRPKMTDIRRPIHCVFGHRRAEDDGIELPSS